MNGILIHPKTDQQLTAFIERPSHAVLIIGPAGSGKLTVANNLAETILKLSPGKIATYGYMRMIEPVGGKAIGIDEIRELERFLSLRVPLRSGFNRAIIIQDSHMLSIEAQNALLKLLEEPPEGTIIILTTNHSQSLLPTIRSRSQTISLTRPGQVQINNYFSDQNHPEAKIKQTYSISGGLPGLMSSLLNEEEHPLVNATSWSRKLIAQTVYERLLAVDELSKDRQLSTDITFILKQMAHVSLQTASGKAAIKWRSILKASYEANQGLSENGNAKLILTKLMLSI